ncbi:MAG TPA: hypothetical protein VE010_18180 [Thermoanaerobaculia bacterium]|nr:hypothetical protein [Thermoanaerobaculia bacterium]
MMLEVETGTDVAAIAVADLSVLEELRSSRGDAFEQQRQAAVEDGRLWRQDVGADGAYLIHLFVDEDPPEHVAAFLRDPRILEPFRVRSGSLLVAGEEFVVTPQPLAKYPHMGREVRVPAGTYKLTAFRVDEAREEWIEEKFAAAVSRGDKRAWDIGNALPAISAAVTIVALVVSYLVFTRTASLLLAALPIGIAVLTWGWQAGFRRSSAYRSAERLYHGLERELPTVVLVLRTLQAT